MASCVNVLLERQAFSRGDLGVNGEGGTGKSGRMKQCKHSVVTCRRVLNKCRAPSALFSHWCSNNHTHLRTRFNYLCATCLWKYFVFTQSNSRKYLSVVLRCIWLHFIRSSYFSFIIIIWNQRKNFTDGSEAWDNDDHPFPLSLPDEKMTGDAPLRTTHRWHRSSSVLSCCNTLNHYY